MTSRTLDRTYQPYLVKLEQVAAEQLWRLHSQKAAQGQLRADLTPYGLHHAIAL